MISGPELASWTDGAARRAVPEFVERTVSDGVPAGEVVAETRGSAHHPARVMQPGKARADHCRRRVMVGEAGNAQP
jgi:hypothetical protein